MEAAVVGIPVSVFQYNRPAINIAKIMQALPECFKTSLGPRLGTTRQEPDSSLPRLLRLDGGRRGKEGQE